MQDILAGILKALKQTPLNLRWVNAEQIHLTVIFLGNISTDILEPMKTAIEVGCSEFGPFRVSLNGMGVFSRRNPRVLWVGLDGDLERMTFFKQNLEKKLSPFGIKEEKRRFNPHLTLGRFRRPNRPGANLDALLLKYNELTSPECSLNELVWFQSEQRPEGSIYTKLNAWPLAGKY